MNSSYIPLYSPRTARLYIYIGLGVIRITGSIRAPCKEYNASTSYKVLMLNKERKKRKERINKDISFYHFGCCYLNSNMNLSKDPTGLMCCGPSLRVVLELGETIYPTP